MLDLGIAIFDPGLDEEYDEIVFPEVRMAESRYMPFVLMEAVQNSAAWGAVRVIPNGDQAVDVTVEATIVHSDGEKLTLQVAAHDTTGRVWLDEDYTGLASKYSYEQGSRSRMDPFQAVYNRIANDLLQKQLALGNVATSEIRLVTEMAFARNFSPDAFSEYLTTTKKGRTTVARLPAEDDPMLERVRKIRERDYLFIDTLQEHYASFNSQMLAPYQEWRKQSYGEVIALRELRKTARDQLIGGVASVIAGIAAASSGNRSARAAGNVAIAGGGYMVKSGLDKRTEAEIHVEALEELGTSLQAEVTPQVIQLEDRTITLSGSVNDQYDQWRELLKSIYDAEIGDLETPARKS